MTNLSDISYNDRDEHSRNTNYDAEILTGSDAGPSNTYRYKMVSKSLLRLKNVKIKRLFSLTKLYFNAGRLHSTYARTNQELTRR